MPGRYVSDTTSKCVTVTQTKWVSNWNIKPWILSEWPWPGYVVVGSATVSTSQILTTTTPVGSSISFTFESAATLENVAQLNIASVSGVPRVSVLETLPTGVEVELTSFVPNVAGTFNLTYTPTQSEVKVKILGTGGSTSIIGWHNLQIWKPQMVQEEVLVDICEKDNDRYMFGFNGMEKDNETKGIGNSLDFGARMYDSRVGRWLSLDPLATKYPSLSPYNFVANNPIWFIDPDGKKIQIRGYKGDYIPGQPSPEGLANDARMVWENLNAAYKIDEKNILSAVESRKVLTIVPTTSKKANTKNGVMKFNPLLAMRVRDNEGNVVGSFSSERIIDHEIRHWLFTEGGEKRPKFTDSDKENPLYKLIKKKNPNYGHIREEYFNIKQDNEISEQINEAGGDEPIRVDHGDVKDFYEVEETMTKEPNPSKVDNATPSQINTTSDEK